MNPRTLVHDRLPLDPTGRKPPGGRTPGSARRAGVPLALSILALTLTPAAGSGARASPSGESQTARDEWPSFRGPGARGWNEGGVPRLDWNVESGEGLRFKVRVPGLGLSSPAVAGDRIFLTSAQGQGDDPDLRIGLYGDIAPVLEEGEFRFLVLAYDRRDGKLRWSRTAHTGVPKIRRHPKSSHANPTPATDGRRVVAFFGSEGLYCYTVEGELLWKKNLGVLDSGYYVAPGAQWGFGSSPVIHAGRVVVQCDVQKNSFLAQFSLEDGSEIWRTPRDEVPTWSTPAIAKHKGRTLIAVNGYRHMGAYDFERGEPIWRMSGGGDIPVPTPVVWNDLVFLTNAHGRYSPIYAVRLEAEGEIVPERTDGGLWTHKYLAWAYPRGGSYMATPIAYRGLFYLVRWNGVLGCYRPETGERLYQVRLGGGGSAFTASPVAAAGYLFFTSEDGSVHIVRAGATFEEVAVRELGEPALATPAVVDGELIFRTQRHLISVRARGDASGKEGGE